MYCLLTLIGMRISLRFSRFKNNVQGCSKMFLDFGVNSVFSLKFDSINAIIFSCFDNQKYESG